MFSPAHPSPASPPHKVRRSSAPPSTRWKVTIARRDAWQQVAEHLGHDGEGPPRGQVPASVRQALAELASQYPVAGLDDPVARELAPQLAEAAEAKAEAAARQQADAEETAHSARGKAEQERATVATAREDVPEGQSSSLAGKTRSVKAEGTSEGLALFSSPKASRTITSSPRTTSRHGVRASQTLTAEERSCRLRLSGFHEVGMSVQREIAVLETLGRWSLTSSKTQLLKELKESCLARLSRYRANASSAAKWLSRSEDLFQAALDDYCAAVSFWRSAELGEEATVGRLLLVRGDHVSDDGTDWYEANWPNFSALWACLNCVTSLDCREALGLPTEDDYDSEDWSDEDDDDEQPFVLDVTGATKLGEGGFAIVYRQRWRGCDVVAKVAKEAGASFDTEAHFAKACEAISVKIFAVQAGILVMNYVESRPLEDLVWGGDYYKQAREGSLRAAERVGTEQVSGWTRDLVTAIGYMEARDIIHRDLKSCNVLINSATQRALVIDFGAAKVLSGYRVSAKFAGIIGTPSHWPPSIWRMDTVLPSEVLSDRYAGGVTLIEMFVNSQATHLVQAQWNFFKTVALTTCKRPLERPNNVAMLQILLSYAKAEATGETRALLEDRQLVLQPVTGPQKL
eukprot:TRINITY_DN17535_c1_g1_i1.p1 TRINITY_DN17535_c1_g1~~TRINITY_DN17535_c1_g1_i1.p1  ORF type:complete len:630 (-),score=130.68 TRINITY_DN17535_c1_g1_i1:163-2052(-)